MNDQEFHTFREYMKKINKNLTASMEDYLEMICRLSKNTGFTRIYELSKSLNVRPPSATKMVQKLAELKLLKYEKYGIVLLEKEGIELGEILLKRHNIVASFLKMIGVEENHILRETEKIEHTISHETLKCINSFMNLIRTKSKLKAALKTKKPN